MKEPTTVIQDSPIARFLFSDVRFAAFWLVVRVYVGWLWLDAGWHKVQDPRWMETGASILGYWKGAVAVPAQGSPRIAFDWYRSFLQLLIDRDMAPAFGKAIAVGETLVGIGLIVGAFVGLAAFFGAAMNFNFMLAGSTSTNPMLFFLAILLIMAWKTAGYYGLDRYLLPILGTPWQPIPMIKAVKPPPQVHGPARV